MIVVTGATGLVGGNLLWQLLQTHDRVRALCRPTSNKEVLRTIFSWYSDHYEPILSRIEWVVADVLDPESLEQVLAGAHTLYHCAAVVSLQQGGAAMIDTNVLGTRHVVEAALRLKIRRFCFVSSIAALGSKGHSGPIDEESIRLADMDYSAYSQSKLLSEQEVWKGISQGLPAVIVNPGVILGVSGTNAGSAALFKQVYDGLRFYTQGGSGYVGVRDVVKVMQLLTENECFGQRYVLVAENCSNLEVMSWMADGYRRPRHFIPIGRSVLLPVAYLMEFVGRLMAVQPVLDRSMARVALGRAYYSSAKLIRDTGFEFGSIRDAIYKVCEFDLNRRD